MADALQGGISLKELSIREDEHDLSRDTADRLALAIEQNTSLKKFVLRVGTMPPAGSHRLLQAFTQNKMLTHVHLTGLVFGNDDSQLPLLGGTDVNCSLEKLVLEAPKNGGRAGVSTRQSIRPMLQYLGSLHSLKSLELAQWNFSTEAFQAVCNELLQKETLKCLTLSGIHFDEERTRILCHLLSNNTSLTELDLIMSLRRRINERERQTLIDGLEHHRKVRLSFIGDWNGVPEIQEKKSAFYNDRNYLLWPLLTAEPPLPLGLWPKVLHRASTYDTSRVANLNMLHFLVKEKCDLFQRVPNRKDNRSNSTAQK